MLNEPQFISEMQAGVRKAFETMTLKYPHEVIYTISIWTDAAASRSAVSFDTFQNSELKRSFANSFRQRLRDRFISQGNVNKVSLVPPDMARNNNPADFAFAKIVVMENTSLQAVQPVDDRTYETLFGLLEQIKMWALTESTLLNLHAEAEIGINGRNTWYGSTVRVGNRGN